MNDKMREDFEAWCKKTGSLPNSYSFEEWEARASQLHEKVKELLATVDRQVLRDALFAADSHSSQPAVKTLAANEIVGELVCGHFDAVRQGHSAGTSNWAFAILRKLQKCQGKDLQPSAPVVPDGHDEPVNGFSENQWWFVELDRCATEPDQRRAVAVVRHLLRSAHKLASKPDKCAPQRWIDFVQEAVGYVGCESYSPSLEREAHQLLAIAAAPQPPAEPINQCDGCQRGLPESMPGMHRDASGLMVCTKGRYVEALKELPNEYFGPHTTQAQRAMIRDAIAADRKLNGRG